MKPILKNDIQQLESRKSHVNRNFEIVQEQVLDKKPNLDSTEDDMF